MRSASIDRAIGRPDRNIPTEEALHILRQRRERILVTGAGGALGVHVVAALREASLPTAPTDVDTTRPWGCTYMDVTDFQSVLEVTAFWEPTLIIHMAAAKHAPEGESDPWSVARINVEGTKNILNVGRRVLLTSTCKAIEPETAYGASKLLAERMVLNAGGSVARFVNVPHCGPNVVQAWEQIPQDQPLPVTPCTRYWMTFREAVALTIWSAVLGAGRYKVDVGDAQPVSEFASLLFPNRPQVDMRPRRGDRLSEPLKGEHEWLAATRVRYIDKVESWHD